MTTGALGVDGGLAFVPPAAASVRGRFLTAVASTVDGIALRAMRTLVDRALMPTPEEIERLRREACFYQQQAFADDPGRFFAFLDAVAAVPEVTLAHRRPPARGAERLRLTFASPYRPVNPAYATAHDAFSENHIVHAELWRHRHGRPRPTVIGLHGFGMGWPALDGLALMASGLFGAGLDVALLTLPLHGARAPRSGRFSGQLFASPDVLRMNESIGQAIHDLAALVQWLRAHGGAPVGVVGLSLGGYLAALAAALLGDLAFVVPVIAPVCFGDLAHRFMAASRFYRDAGAAVMSRDECRAMYRIHSPLAHRPRLARESLLILAARGDRVVPAEHAQWLWSHWNEPQLTWLTGSHLVPFERSRMLAEIVRLVERLGILSRRTF